MASKINIGAQIQLDGEKTYREALKNIRAEQRLLTSEMKVAKTEFADNANSVEALEAKHSVLTKQISKQTELTKLYTNAVEDSIEKQEKIASETETYKNELSKAQSELDDMKKSSNTTTDALEKQEKVVSDLEKKVTLSTNAYAKAETSTLKYKTSLNTAEAGLNKFNNELVQNEKYLDEAKNSTDGNATSIDSYGKKVKIATTNTNEFSEKSTQGINQVAGVLAASGIARGIEEIAEALIDCSNAAGEFETGIKKVSTVADTTVTSEQEISSELLKLSSDIGEYSNSLTDSVYNAISAGVDTAEAVKFTGEATKLAVAGFTDATTAVDILTTAENAYNLSVDETTRVSDILITTQNQGKTTVAELADTYGKVIPIAAAYNVDLENLSASTAILTANGIKTNLAITYQKALFNELGDSSSQTAKILKDETGQSFSQLIQSGSSLGDVISILGESVNNNASEFSNLWSSSEAGVSALTLLNAGTKEFNSTLKLMQDSTGATERAFESMTDTEEYANQRMLVSLENLKIAIGDELNPALKDLEETGADAFDWATEFVQDNPEVVQGFTALTIGVGVFTGGIIAANVAMLALNATMALNPAVAIAAGVIALGTALTVLAVSMKEADTEAQILTADAKELNETLSTSVETRDKSVESIKTEASYMKELSAELDSLNSKESLSADEKLRLNDIVTQLNTSMPDLNLAIDDQTGKIIGNTDAINDSITANLAWYKVQGAREELTALMEEQAEAEFEIYKIDQEIIEQNQKLTDAQDKVTEAYNAYIEAGGDGIDIQNALNSAYNEMDAVTSETEEAIEELNEQKEALNDTESDQLEQAELLNGYIAENTTLTEENAEATGNSTEAYTVYGDVISNVTDTMATSLETLNESFNDAKESADDSLTSQIGLFEAAEEQSTISVEKMAENLASQTEAFNQYKEDLLTASDLVEQGLMDEGLLGQIESFGIDGAGYLNELVNAAETDTENFNAVMEQWSLLDVAKDGLSDSMAELETNYQDGLESITENAEENGETLVTDFSLGVRSGVYEAVDATDFLVSDTTGALTTGLEGVGTQAGTDLVDELANSIQANGSKVNSAFQSIITESITNADYSGLSAQIDQKLGEALY